MIKVMSTMAAAGPALRPWIGIALLCLSEGCAGNVGARDVPVPVEEPQGPFAADTHCTRISETAYTKGAASPIEVITIASIQVALTAAHAYLRLRDAAAVEGVRLVLNSGFRSVKGQEYLYGCYQSGKCNSGNSAAKPGYSNHQNGIALDIHDPSGRWLYARAKSFGFHNTVPSEPWHWEYAGADSGGMCNE